MPNCSGYDLPDPTLNSYVESLLGTRCPDLFMAKVTVVIYAVILSLGLTGNILTCWVIASDKQMRTVTNIYLFSLAVSDLLSLILGLPFELYHAETVEYPYTLPQFICPTRAFMTEMTSYASVLILSAFTIERWMAICFPMRFRGKSKFSRATKIIFGVWIVSVICASPQLMLVRVAPLSVSELDLNYSNPLNYTVIPNTEHCEAIEDFASIHTAVINVSFWMFFIIPMLLMTGMYTHIGLCIKAANKRNLNDAESRKHQTNNRGKSVIQMLLSVVAAFFICWLPFHLQRISSIYVPMDSYKENEFLRDLMDRIFYISGYFYYSNAAINPILYNVSNRRFRESFLRSLCCRTTKKILVNTTITGNQIGTNRASFHRSRLSTRAAKSAKLKTPIPLSYSNRCNFAAVSCDNGINDETYELSEAVMV